MVILVATYVSYSLVYCTRKPLSVVKSTMKEDPELAGSDIDYPLVETSFFLMYAKLFIVCCCCCCCCR